ncbi:MAG: sulfurtransferase complex subunit TusC [Motiliproteus sp.]
MSQPTQNNTLLLVIRHSPYANQVAREAFDAALTAAAFEVPLSVLLLDDGCYSLLASQQPEQLQAKNLGKTLPALAMYDIERVYTASSALTQRGIDPTQLQIDAELLDDADVSALFHQHQHILSF